VPPVASDRTSLLDIAPGFASRRVQELEGAKAGQRSVHQDYLELLAAVPGRIGVEPDARIELY
jgi:hypothetical protein